MRKYRTIVADPPWDYSDGFAYLKQDGTVENKRLPYPSMSLQEIEALPVRDLADDACRLFMWTTNRYLDDSFDVMKAWGFRYRQTLVWHKKGCNPLTGSVAPNSAEFLMVAVRGMPPRLGKFPSAVIEASVEGHSKKPELWLDWIETVSPGPHLEMFARRNRFGWDTWGNQSICHVEVDVPVEEEAIDHRQDKLDNEKMNGEHADWDHIGEHR